MKESKLMVHCGGQLVERDEVAAVFTPAPTETWRPVSHLRVIESVEKALGSLGMEVVTTAYALAAEGKRFFGLMQVSRVEQTHISEDNQDYGYVVGLRNSHDKMFPVTLCVGSSVFACDNLAISSEINVVRKHTVYVERDLPLLVNKAVGRLAEGWNNQEVRFEAYKGRDLSDAQANDLIVRAYEGGVAPITALPDVIREWRSPSHPEFAERRNAWRLFNGFTEALKGNLWALPKRTQALHALLDTDCGLMNRQVGTIIASAN